MAMEQQELKIEQPELTHWGFNSKTLNKNIIKETKQNYKQLGILGQGSIGIVLKVQEVKTGKVYAMKEMSKAKYFCFLFRAIAKRNIEFIMNQRKILPFVKSDFFVNMTTAFQDQTSLYLILDYLEGKDLRYHMKKHKKFSQEQVRFFVGCLYVSLEYLEDKCIVQRDIKP